MFYCLGISKSNCYRLELSNFKWCISSRVFSKNLKCRRFGVGNLRDWNTSSNFEIIAEEFQSTVATDVSFNYIPSFQKNLLAFEIYFLFQVSCFDNFKTSKAIFHICHDKVQVLDHDKTLIQGWYSGRMQKW